MEKPLRIPPGKKIKNLTVYCRHKDCKTNVSDICKCNGKELSKCPHPEKHVFKSYVLVPGSGNERRTKQYESRDINEVIPQALAFEKMVKENKGDNEDVVIAALKDKETKSLANVPTSLAHVLARFIAYQANENVPSHLQRERSTEYIRDMERSAKLFAECLVKNKRNILETDISDLNDEIVGEFYDFLVKDQKFSGRTFNKKMGHLTSCITWYNEHYNASIKNYFEKVPRKTVNYNPEVISKEEFDNLLQIITHENGYIEYETGVKKIRNVYRPWLKDGLRLALETGRRREEIINLKHSDIHIDDTGLGFIKVEDYKVNRIQNRVTEDSKKFILIPMTKSLKDLIGELKTNNFRDTDYILAPGVKIKRNKIMSDILSRGFAHYYKQLNTGRKLSFGALRKTYLTQMDIFTAGNAKSISGHSSNKVLDDHYINKIERVKAVNGFNVFETTERQNDLENIRSNVKGQNNEIKGIEK